MTWLQRLAGMLTAMCAVLIIATAVVVGIGRAFIPHADEIRPWLEAQLGERLGMPVEIGRVEAQWPRLTPQITLSSIRIGDSDEQLIGIDSARLELYLPGLINTHANLLNIAVLGLDLELAEDENGRWGLRLEEGGRMGGGNGAPPDRMLTGHLLLRNVNVRVVPHRLPATEWHLSEAELERGIDQTALVGRVHPAADRQSTLELRLRVDHAGSAADAVSAWLGVSRLELDSGLARQFLPSEVELPNRRFSAGAWLEWAPETGGRLDVEFAFEGGRHETVTGVIQAERQQRRFDAELVALKIGDELAVSGLRMAQLNRVWAVAVDSIDLNTLHRIVSPAGAVLPHWPEFLAGRIEELLVVFHSHEGLHALEGRINELAMTPVGPLPGVSGLDLDMALAGDRIVLRPGGEVSVDWPNMLRQEVHLERIGGRLVLAPGSIELDNFAIDHAVVDAVANGWIYLGDKRPFLDFGIDVARLETGDPRPWLPHGIVPPRTLEWLDQALAFIDHGHGDLLFHMRAGQSAGDFDPGDFHARVDFSGARLDYWPGWPAADLHQGQVEFLGRSVFGRVPKSAMRGLDLSVEQVVIEDLTEPELVFLVVAQQADASELTDVLARMPVAGWRGMFEQTNWTGPLSFSTEVTLPFRHMEHWGLDGEASFDGVKFSLPAVGVELPDLRGTAFFDRHQLVPTALHAMAARRMITIDTAATFDPPVRLELGAQLHPADLIVDEVLARNLRERVSGMSYWEFGLSALDDGLHLALSGDLEGSGMSLPDPLTKLSAESWPIKADARLSEELLDVRVALAERLDLAMMHDAAGWRAAIGVYQPHPEWPESAGFSMAGTMEDLDLYPWAAILTDLLGPDRGGAGAGTMRLQLGRLSWGDHYLEEVEVDAERIEEAWELSLAGRGTQGRVTVPMPLDSGRVLAIDLARLHIKSDREEFDEADLHSRSTPTQTSTVNPVGHPPLHLLVEDLRYRDLEIGRARVETHAFSDGVEIERVEANGPSLRLQGAGRWMITPDGPFSEFEGRLMTASLTDLLKVLGYETGLEATRTQADLVGRWPGAPQDFSLQRLDGRMAIDIADGLIPEARPGAGRLLGLISIGTIPRRLMLDFRDVFAQGLKFDRIDGSFTLDGGIAVTEDLLVDSPAARIRVSGSTDMVDRRYDQYLVVEPGVGGTLPLIGVLAGGPMGAAAGLVLQTLLDRPLRGIAEARYSVTGSWDSPVVELVEARVADEEGVEEVIIPDIPPPD